MGIIDRSVVKAVVERDGKNLIQNLGEYAYLRKSIRTRNCWNNCTRPLDSTNWGKFLGMAKDAKESCPAKKLNAFNYINYLLSFAYQLATPRFTLRGFIWFQKDWS